MATFADYDEERRLMAGFGANNVSWQGDGWAVRFEGKTWTVPRGLVTSAGIDAIKQAMKEKIDGGSTTQSTEATEGERL